MLDQSTRTAILELHERGLSIRGIARALKVSRGAVRGVIASGSAEVPRLERPEKAEPFRDRILELFADCKGNLVRVQEELEREEGYDLSYQALTAYCRRHGIGKQPKPRSGQYHFEPGQEMQHDTSPHRIKIGGKVRQAQAASLVLCHSRMIYLQYYPTFKRFDCKVFLTEAARYFGGVCATCMIDNTHVVVLKGTGRDMIPVPEMVAFSEQLGGFEFVAHEKGHANRSARVERPFHYAENNFVPGREGTDWRDFNRQAVEWCDTVNAKYRRHLRASPRDLFAAERSHLKPLPDWIPEVYQLHHRIVGVDGYVTLHTNLYSVPLGIPVGRRVEVREDKDHVDIYLGPRRVARHQRQLDPIGKRVTDPSHRASRKRRRREPPPEEQELSALAPELSGYVAKLKKRPGSTTLALRRLLGMVRDYPRDPLVDAIKHAEHYGLFDLERVERMVLKRIAGDFFLLPGDALEDPHE
ncbi:MAG: integrase [Maricaulis sp.]|nr:integrase [Maricaulis sp.]|tara:strand:+ start:384 stop:1793 length:1410 start_codon:yes stop_codon:yes gene_type:complete